MLVPHPLSKQTLGKQGPNRVATSDKKKLSKDMKKKEEKIKINLSLCLSKHNAMIKYQGVSKSFRTGRLEQELQMVQLSNIRCSCIAIL
jgi:hypothetical protein